MDFEIRIKPSGRSLRAEEGTTLMDALADAGIMIKSPCGGRGICGKCTVKATGRLSPRTGREEGLPDGTRLSCTARISGNAEITVDEVRKAPVFPEVHAGKPGPFAAAIDIGTTSVKISITDLSSGEARPYDFFLNPQRRYGDDVISRIAASAGTDARGALSKLIRRDISASLSGAGIAFKKAVVSGNTAMSYFLLGLDPGPLGRHPYTAPVLDFPSLRASALGMEIPGDPETGVLPSVSAFLGGDLAGGLAVTDAAGYAKNVFYIDMGTNGEMFLRPSSGGIYAASCAMGPALEGMNISCGMTADEGAINHVSIRQGSFAISVIGGGKAAGICGTGLIDATACLIAAGIISRSGSMAKSIAPGSPAGLFISEKGVHLAGDVFISQKDIRNLQLAKGASLAAAEILLEEAGCDPGSISHVFIAGEFGENVDVGNLKRLSFLPDFRNAVYFFLGNTSLRAAEMACLDAGFIGRIGSLRHGIRAVELSSRPGFDEKFLASLDFRAD
ncbi:MAG: ASKHA domain-containing protein [Spirochaetes bacterium]|jgi:uncharacterized 2Fe-2S/4Fe-4S cluster protein (DUF4445 family)|nr:ASKHA domain-containing protein [Spirochaetota bacterium]